MYGSNRGNHRTQRRGNHRGGSGARSNRYYNDRKPPKESNSNPFLAAGSKSWEEIQAENRAQLNTPSTSSNHHTNHSNNTNTNATANKYNNPYIDNKLLQDTRSQFNPTANNQFINKHSPNTIHSTNNAPYTPSHNNANSQHGTKHRPSKSNPFLGPGSKSWTEIQAENEDASSTSTSHEIKDNDPPKHDHMEWVQKQPNKPQTTDNLHHEIAQNAEQVGIDYEAMVADIAQQWNLRVEEAKEKKEKKRLERIQKEQERLQHKQHQLLQQQLHANKKGAVWAAPNMNNPLLNLPCINEDNYTQNNYITQDEQYMMEQAFFYDGNGEDEDLQIELESGSNSAEQQNGHFMASPGVKDFGDKKGKIITKDTVYSLKPNDVIYRQAENKQDGWEMLTVHSVDPQDGLLTLHGSKHGGTERVALFPEQLEDETLVLVEKDEWAGSHGEVHIGDWVKLTDGKIYKVKAMESNSQCRLESIKDKTEVVLDLSVMAYQII